MQPFEKENQVKKMYEYYASNYKKNGYICI